MSAMSHHPPRCGRIAYTNDLPVYAGIDHDVVQFPGSMVADVPANLNAALLEGRLDISPISSAFYAEHADALALLPGVCIGSRSRVVSICCISARAPSQLAGTPIAVTRESATGRALFQLICRAHYGFDPVMVPSDDPFGQHLADGSPCLVIGDKAIDAGEAAPPDSVHDLGTLWNELTGSGMVYAVWAARRDYLAQDADEVRAVARVLEMSLEWGLENLDLVIKRAEALHPRAPHFYADYYHALDFRFDDRAQAALADFIARAHAAQVLEHAPPLRFFDEVPQHV
jgi:chorismate dehydratase